MWKSSAFKAAEGLQGLIAADRSHRGAPKLYSPEGLVRMLEMVLQARRIAIVTGFFIGSCGAAETDGPCGAAALARGCLIRGKEAKLFTDGPCFPVVATAAETLGVTALEISTSEELLKWRPDLICFLERPGMASDGGYYSMYGQDHRDLVAPLDHFLLKDPPPVATIAIGDGGNEAGMGVLSRQLGDMLPEFRPFLASTAAQEALAVDVSDWGGYAMAAMMSLPDQWCGLSEEELASSLEAMVATGAVDGVVKRPQLSIDGVSLDCNCSVLRDVNHLCRSCLCIGNR